MDELKLVLNTKFMKNIVTKIIAKAIHKKTGYKVDVQLNEVRVESMDGKIHLHTNLDAEINTEDFIKIVKSGDFI